MRLALAMIAAAIIAGTGGWLTSGSKAFDAVAWRNQTARQPVRTTLVDDLLQGGRLDGATRSEVVSLLGQPDDTSYFSDWDMVYWLGPARGFMSIDSEWLVIRLVDSKVGDARLVRD